MQLPPIWIRWLTCDGMPWPSAAWTRAFDEHGCPTWIEPSETDECCGCP